MPTGDTKGQFQTLYNTAGLANNTSGSIKIRGLPYGFRYVGFIGNGVLGSETAIGYWWSCTPSGSQATYSLYVHANQVNPISLSGRNGGFSLRCITTPTS